jgi:hypothetical protein
MRRRQAFTWPDGDDARGHAPLGEWDFIYLQATGDPIALEFTKPTTLLLLTLRHDGPAQAPLHPQEKD